MSRATWIAVAAAAAAAAPAVPAGAAQRLGQRTLERGDRGADVRELQRTLRRLDIRVRVDGALGSGTVRAVRRYERREDLRVDGRVSPGQARGMRARAGTLPFGERVLRRGHRGRDVRRLQRVLTELGVRTRADGVFGRTTERRVRRWERKQQAPADGRVPPEQARRMLAELERGRAATRATAGGTFPVAGDWRWGGDGAGFGERGGRHQGVDLFAACGTPLVSPVAAEVVHVARHERAGHYAVLRAQATGEDLVFMHLRSAPDVAEREQVAQGARIGEVGDTGNARGCHLHFEIWKAPGWYRGGEPRDPEPDLRRWAG